MYPAIQILIRNEIARRVQRPDSDTLKRPNLGGKMFCASFLLVHFCTRCTSAFAQRIECPYGAPPKTGTRLLQLSTTTECSTVIGLSWRVNSKENELQVQIANCLYIQTVSKVMSTEVVPNTYIWLGLWSYSAY